VHALRESGMPDRALEALLERCQQERREAGQE
jgi:cation transport protein ChaC